MRYSNWSREGHGTAALISICGLIKVDRVWKSAKAIGHDECGFKGFESRCLSPLIR